MLDSLQIEGRAEVRTGVAAAPSVWAYGTETGALAVPDAPKDGMSVQFRIGVASNRVFTRALAGLLLMATTAVATACNRSADAAAHGGPSGASTANPSGSPAAAVATTARDTGSAAFDRGRILGDSTAKVWFVMVSDFQCPYCKQFHDESFAALRQDYVANGKIRMAFVNFPLPIHQNAWPAAEAAMCAGPQGKFWPMHDVLFASQDAWAEQRSAGRAIDSLASSVGIDTVALDRCVTQHAAKGLIAADIDRSERAGARSTPTVIIGTTVLIGVQPTANYRRAIDSALAAAK